MMQLENLITELKKLNLPLGKEYESNSYSLLSFLYGKVYDKELTHSQIIADFLNPTGSHHCGYLFINYFFNLIGLDKTLDDKNNVSIKLERPVFPVGSMSKGWVICPKTKHFG